MKEIKIKKAKHVPKIKLKTKHHSVVKNIQPKKIMSEKPIQEKVAVEPEKPKVRFISIDSEDAGQRIDNFLLRIFFIYQLIQSHPILL